MSTNIAIDPNLDLVFERVVPISAEKLWKGWTDPEVLPKWFTPKPWVTTECKIDLRPGGRFYAVMRSPEGQEFPNQGCYLEIIPNKKLIWTNFLQGGFRPADIGEGGFGFTGIILLDNSKEGTLYKAIVMHKNEQDRKIHEQMNFQEGWGKAFDQLIDLMK